MALRLVIGGRGKLRIIAVLLLTAAGTPLGYAALSWPRVSRLAGENPSSTAFIERYREGQRNAPKPDRVKWRWVPRDAISPNLQRAVVSAEDIGFFSHGGFELAEIRQAVREAVRAGSAPRGASTITQQLAKNLWLSPSRNPWRKVKEVILTWQLEKALPKRRILELYLNVAEFGPGVYGAEAAAWHYFGQPAATLTEHQAAQLAASLPRPRTWNPRSTSERYQRQVALIESRMAKASFLWDRIGQKAGSPEPAGAAAADSALAEFLRSDTLFQLAPDSADTLAARDSTTG